MSISELHQIDWQAFCYVSNELSAEERLAFEESLAIDQVAREALARAVELTRAVAAAESQESPLATPLESAVVIKAGSNWTRRISWMALGAAASLLAAVLLSNFGDADSVSTLVNPHGDQSNRELASAWSETRADLAPRETSWSSSELSELTEELATAYASADESAEAVAAETPSWMTAALLAQAEQAPETSLDVLKNAPAGPRLEN